jgi:hypothetical protein
MIWQRGSRTAGKKPYLKLTKQVSRGQFNMNKKGLKIFTVLSLFTAVAQAEVECRDPVGKWQPRQQLRHKLEQKGWQVKRIRVDDNCYEVKALDNHGNKIEARFGPAELDILELEVEVVGKEKIEKFLENHGEAQPLPAIKHKNSKEIVK